MHSVQELVGLGHLSPHTRERILSISEPVWFAAGQTIFREGDPARNLYILTHGIVSIETHAPPRGARVLSTIGAGDWFSWSAMIEPWLETATCRAVQESAALSIPAGKLMDLCRDDSKLGFEIYRVLSTVIAKRLQAATLQLVNEIDHPVRPA